MELFVVGPMPRFFVKFTAVYIRVRFFFKTIELSLNDGIVERVNNLGNFDDATSISAFFIIPGQDMNFFSKTSRRNY
jgi:hypothetical protein